jgi:hypothetical protein
MQQDDNAHFTVWSTGKRLDAVMAPSERHLEILDGGGHEGIPAQQYIRHGDRRAALAVSLDQAHLRSATSLTTTTGMSRASTTDCRAPIATAP